MSSDNLVAAQETAVLDVLDHYRAIGGIRIVRPLDKGFGCAKWHVTTRSGRFVLRRFPSPMALDRVEFISAVQMHAAWRTGLAPDLMPNELGRLVTAHKGRLYTVAEYMEGVCDATAIPDEDSCRSLGHVLGRLHLALRDIRAAYAGPPVASDPTAKLRAALEAHEGTNCPHQEARQVLAAKLKRATLLSPKELELVHTLPRSVIHGDLHLGNLIFAQGHVIAAIDFDLTRVFPPAYELVRGLIYCVKPTGGPGVFTRRVQAFLEAYLNIVQLQEKEIVRMVPLFQSVQILDPYGLDICKGASRDLLDFGQARFALLRWVDRYETLLTTLAQTVGR